MSCCHVPVNIIDDHEHSKEVEKYFSSHDWTFRDNVFVTDVFARLKSCPVPANREKRWTVSSVFYATFHQPSNEAALPVRHIVSLQPVSYAYWPLSNQTNI